MYAVLLTLCKNITECSVSCEQVLRTKTKQLLINIDNSCIESTLPMYLSALVVAEIIKNYILCHPRPEYPERRNKKFYTKIEIYI